jgi:heme oxygenase
MSLRQALKAGTSDLHEDLDARLGRYDLADAEDYRTFLMVQARVLPAIEQALEEGGIGSIVADWSDHLRAPLIERDLEALGAAMPPPIAVPHIAGAPQLLGTAYVIEGSRLGSRYLARRVGTAMPAEFLNATGQQKAWPALLNALDRLDFSPSDSRSAVAAARVCFALFLAAAHEAHTNA